MVELSGSLVAIVTPFRDGEIDGEAFSRLVDWHVTAGTSGIVVAGTTGEAATLHFEEREVLCRRALEAAAGRVPVVMGSGTNCTWASEDLTRAAVRWGADALLVVAPYYNKPTQEGIFRHYQAVARAAHGCPVIAYDVPGRTGITFEETTVHRLAGIEGVVALKDATGDVERATRLARETPLTILSGDDAQTLPMMRGGARGVVSVAANIVPDAIARLCAELDESLHEQLLPLFGALFLESNPIPVKYAMSERVLIENELRLPLVPLSQKHRAAVRDAIPD